MKLNITTVDTASVKLTAARGGRKTAVYAAILDAVKKLPKGKAIALQDAFPKSMRYSLLKYAEKNAVLGLNVRIEEGTGRFVIFLGEQPTATAPVKGKK